MNPRNRRRSHRSAPGVLLFFGVVKERAWFPVAPLVCPEGQPSSLQRGSLRRWLPPGAMRQTQVGLADQHRQQPTTKRLSSLEGACGGGCCREGSAFLCVGCSRNPPGGYAATPLWQGRAAEVGVAGRGLLTRWFGALVRVGSHPQPHGARNAAGGRPPTADRRAEGRPPARTGPHASGGGRGGTLPR